MEISIRKYETPKGTFYFMFNFAAGIAYEEMSGNVADEVTSTKDMAQFIWCGTVEGMREIGEDYNLTFEEFTHDVNMSVVGVIFGSLKEKKKRLRFFRRRQKK